MEDNYKQWYEEAIAASNECGFSCMSAAEVIKYQDAEIQALEKKIKALELRISDYSWEASARHAQQTGGWQ